MYFLELPEKNNRALSACYFEMFGVVTLNGTIKEITDIEVS